MAFQAVITSLTFFVLIHGSSPRTSLTKDDCETNRLRREGEEEEDNEAQNATLRWFLFVEFCQYDDKLTISYIFGKMWMQGKLDYILGERYVWLCEVRDSWDELEGLWIKGFQMREMEDDPTCWDETKHTKIRWITLGFDGPTSPTDPFDVGWKKVIVDQGPVEIDCKNHRILLDSYLGDLQVDLLVDLKKADRWSARDGVRLAEAYVRTMLFVTYGVRSC